MWPILLQILKEACKYNLHVFAALILIIGVIGYCLHKFLMSQQDINHRFNFIGGKLTDIDKKVDGLVYTVTEHSDKIIALESVQGEWNKFLKNKFIKEDGRSHGISSNS
jgi:hypothetical protein